MNSIIFLIILLIFVIICIHEKFDTIERFSNKILNLNLNVNTANSNPNIITPYYGPWYYNYFGNYLGYNNFRWYNYYGIPYPWYY